MFLVNKFICTIKLQIVSYKFRVHLFCILPCEQRISEHIERDVHLLSNFNVQLNQRAILWLKSKRNKGLDDMFISSHKGLLYKEMPCCNIS